MLRSLLLRPSHIRRCRFIMSDSSSLSTAIAEQTARLNELRLQKDVDNAAVEDTKKKLGELKKALGAINKANALAAASSKQSPSTATASDGKKRERVLLKTAKVRLQHK